MNSFNRWVGNEPILSWVLMKMPEHVALIDSQGWIVWTNQAWKRFSDENDGNAEKTGVGVNYLSICERAERENFREAGILRAEILAMLGKRTSTHERGGELEYPCDSPQEKRWFYAWLLRCEIDDEVFVAVIHENVTSRHALADRIFELQQRLSAQEHAAAFAESAGFISHEIKNPLSVVLIHAGITRKKLQARSNDYEGMIESCNKIEQTLGQLIEIVNGMLSMFKSTAEESCEFLNVKSLFDEVIEMSRDFIGSVKIQVSRNAALKHLRVEGNRVHLLQILSNLIRNAVRALNQSSHPRIRLKADETSEEIRLVVIDNGPGVPPGLRPQFKKGGKSEVIRQGQGGSGVGFKIARTLAEAHGGSLYLDESCRETCFVLSLPRIQAQSRCAKAS